ncbi:ATP synthase F1, gamma subunit [Rubrobacter radiotolerans]|uniref:ATP synthase gamma chain n=1 Tax=Rubrobacter radiotolerans TaxID=42256 RepID=A0A023X3D8_RUBRA|nr:ATP synthase F1 subunit gamma [Rubrobacter radiotolerans]AHY46863.1 ATP synthase F1, gamma subunit [Rubrobacter radiotolerans]MDX5894268.1 ATP synthase F1 subunit gamma [Rubrobacter radiotolerans]SMC05606.1 ATP synthase F1 subcomplex gamma subunit [Rubrobacter radiotolerans DSM 5868]
MASIRDLKRQIQSVKNQSRVFSALQTVSAVKFRNAEGRVKRARPYADNIEEMMREVASDSTSKLPMLVGRSEVRRVAIASLTSDRGLCGSFNSQVLRRTMQLREEKGRDALQVASGRKSVSFFKFRGVKVAREFTGHTDNPSYDDAREIGRALTALFEDEEADEVYLVYNRFESALTQRPVVKKLLPAAAGDEDDADEREDARDETNVPFEFVNSAEEILGALIPRYVETMVWQALLEGATGEHGARMTAMQSASDNANELADNLTLQMNKARQAQITQELLEIVGGAEALASG